MNCTIFNAFSQVACQLILTVEVFNTLTPKLFLSLALILLSAKKSDFAIYMILAAFISLVSEAFSIFASVVCTLVVVEAGVTRKLVCE